METTTKNEIVKINPADYGLEENKANELIKNLPQIINERDAFISQFDMVIRMDIEDPETAKKARELRLRIRDNRTKGIEVWHKTTKDFFLKGGQFVDAIKRKEIAVNERMETDLEKIEKYQENLERERTEKLRTDRLNLLKPYTDIEPLALGHMEQSVFDNYLAGVKLAHETKIAAEKKAEEDRIAREKVDAEEREAQRLENIRLKKEKEDADNKIIEEANKKRELEIKRFPERKKIMIDLGFEYNEKREYQFSSSYWSAFQEQIEQPDDKEFESYINAIKQARTKHYENERLKAELKVKQDKEDAEKKKLQADQRAKAAEEKKAKLAPDKTKLLNFMQTLNDLPRPEVKSIEAADIASKVNIMLVQVSNFIRDNANKL